VKSAAMMIQEPLLLGFSRRSKPAALFAIALSLAPLAAAHSLHPSFPEANVTWGRTAAGYPYQSGGVSFDEQRAMERASHSYNLKLVFASGAGTLVVPDFVVIGANHGRSVEKIPLRAPWFYIQLPAGAYTILARWKRRIVLIRDVHLREGQLRTYRVRVD
jgi:hypothetical protein